MNALSLKAVVSGSLADVGVDEKAFPPTRGRPRDTVWFTMESGFGMRRYASGRNVYIVQSRMNGRVRTMTIGPASLLTQAMAASVAKRVIAHALVGNDPAEDRKRIRNAPSFDDFVKEYWEKCAPTWKLSTRKSQDVYRRILIEANSRTDMSMTSSQATLPDGLRARPIAAGRAAPTGLSICFARCSTRLSNGVIASKTPTLVPANARTEPASSNAS